MAGEEDTQAGVLDDGDRRPSGDDSRQHLVGAEKVLEGAQEKHHQVGLGGR